MKITVDNLNSLSATIDGLNAVSNTINGLPDQTAKINEGIDLLDYYSATIDGLNALSSTIDGLAIPAVKIQSSSGSVTLSRVSGATGLQAIGSPGSVLATLQRAITGSQAANSPGVIQAMPTALLSGISALVSAGSVSTGRLSSEIGNAVIALQGTVASSLSIALNGSSINSQSGVIAGQLQRPANGNSSTVSAGGATSSTSGALAGFQVITNYGLVGFTPELKGNAALLGTGTAKPIISLALTGQSSSVNPGSIVSSGSLTVTGLAAGASVSAVGPSGSQLLSGTAITPQYGSVQATSGGSAILTGSVAAAAQGVPVQSITIAITGGQVSIAAGLTQAGSPISATTNEVILRKWYVRRNNKLHVFASADDADAFIEADEKASQAIAQAQKTSRLARKRLRNKVISAALPETTVQIDYLAQLVSRYAIPVNLPDVVAQQDWERVLQIMAMALQAQDDEDIEMLLMA